MKYRVLWLEDESDKMDAFFDLAYSNEIELIPVDTFADFKNAIEKNSRFYFDAVILDAIGLIDNKEEKATIRALEMAKNFIIQHKSVEVIPYFILSGYLGNAAHSSVLEMLGNENVYYKSKDEKQLLADIQASMDSKQETQLKHKYRDLLEVCAKEFIGSEHFSRLFSLIIHVENLEKLSDTEDMLNPLRKIIEAVFHSLAQYNLVPLDIVNNPGWLNGTSAFLANKHSQYEHIHPFVHPTVSDSIFRLLNITQDASHSEGGLRLRVDEYLKHNKSDYLFRSCVFLLFEILIWYKDAVIQNNNPEKNNNLWRELPKIDSLTLTLEKDALGNYHCGEMILTYKEVNDNGYVVGDRISIMQTKTNTNEKTNQYYKIVAIKTQKSN